MGRQSTFEIEEALKLTQLENQQLQNELLRKQIAQLENRTHHGEDSLKAVEEERKKLGSLPQPNAQAIAYHINIDQSKTGPKYYIEVLQGKKTVEAYVGLTKEHALVHIAALLNGFQPPRSLCRHDIQIE